MKREVNILAHNEQMIFSLTWSIQYWPLSFRSASISMTTEFGKETKHSISQFFFNHSFIPFSGLTFSCFSSSGKINSVTSLSHEPSFWIQGGRRVIRPVKMVLSVNCSQSLVVFLSVTLRENPKMDILT